VTVCHSSDAGRRWAIVGHFRAIGTAGQPQFVDSRHGWLITSPGGGMHSLSSSYLYRSADGGRHWRHVAAAIAGPAGEHSIGGLPPSCDAGVASFVDDQTGWYFGGCTQGGGLLREGQTGWARFLAVTHDGGKHWQSVRLPHPRIGAARAGCPAGVACSVMLLALRPHLVELFAGGGAAASPNVIYRSTDGGTTWTTEPLPLASTLVATADGIHFIQLSEESRTAYTSNDSGRSWRHLSDLPHPAVSDPLTVDRRTAFAVLADSRGLYRTDDGGHTWTHVEARLSPAR
jgi:photosystem II stability/assembly factor-like uncharacterized protein